MAEVTHGKIQAQDELSDAIHAVAEAQSALLGEAVALGTTIANAMDALPGFVPCDHAFVELLLGMSFSTGKQNLDELAQVKAGAYNRRMHIADHRGVATPEPSDVLATLAKLSETDAARVKLSLLALMQAIAPYAHRAMELGAMQQQLNVDFARACSLINSADVDVAAAQELEAALVNDYQTALTLGF